MKIGIDLKPFYTGSKYRGIGMYSRSLIKKVLEYGRENEYHFLSLYGEYDGDPELTPNCFVHTYETGPKIVDVGERQLLRDVTTMKLIEAEVKHFLTKSKVDVMLFTSPTEYGNMYKAEWFDGVTKVGVLYDLIPLMFPKQCLFDKTYSQDYYDSLEFLKSMDFLLAISQSAKDDAVKLLGINPEKIVVIYAGIDNAFRRLEKVNMWELKKKYSITDAFILFAGGIDFKKNIEDLILAYSKCERSITKNYQLVITGKASNDVLDKYLSIAKECGVEERVICTGYIPLDDLVALYNITDLLVFPSLYEGFGLPVIEAMACGARVLTSDCSSLKEIADGHGTLVNPKSVKSITKGIEYVFNHPAETKNIAEKSIDYAKSFTWDRVAKKVLDIFAAIDVKSDKIAYGFKLDDKLLRNVAELYVEQRIRNADNDFEKLSKELEILQENKDKTIIQGGNRILYDVTVVREWLKAKYSTGIGRVSKELLISLKKMSYVIPVEVSIKNGSPCIKRVDTITWDVTNEVIVPRNTDVYFMPELQLRGIQVDRNHPKANVLRNQGIRCYAVIYDILPLRMPQYFEDKTSKAFDGYLREIVDNYDGILCDSKFVDDDIVNYCQEHKIQSADGHEVVIGYFHLGSNSFEKKKEQSVSLDIKRFVDTEEKVFLMLGTIEPRKGHKDVLKAFEQLWEEGCNYKLCIAGHVGWNMGDFVDDIKNHPQLGKNLGFFEAISDSEVKYLYYHVTGLIQASYGEGYGLPLIEAGHYGVPILCSDIEVFHEVAGENAVYFTPHDIEQLQSRVIEFAQLVDQNKVPCSSKIKPTTWDQVATRVLNMLLYDKDWYKELK